MDDAPAALPSVPPGPALAAILEPGELVHWQGAPANGGAGAILGWIVSAGLVAAGIAAAAGLVMAGPGTALAVAGAGALFGVAGWMDRPARWTYALTDRRLLILRGGAMWAHATSETLENLRLRSNRDGTSDVLWRDGARVRVDRKGRRRTGFLRQRDGAALEGLIRTWHSIFAARSEIAAVAFTGSPAASDATPGAVRISNRDLGFRLEAPSGWTATVRRRTDGPLMVFGVTLLPRVVREGEPVPWNGQTGGWNALTLRGAQATGFDLFAKAEPLSLTLREVLDDPWARGLGIETVETDPDVRIGPWRGFAVTRTLPRGGNLTGFGVVPVPVITRQVWLGSDAVAFEIQGVAPADASGAEGAMRRIVDSLSPAP